MRWRSAQTDRVGDGAAFELVVTPSRPGASQRMPGETVMVRLERPCRPLLLQWWRSIRQLARPRLGLF